MCFIAIAFVSSCSKDDIVVTAPEEESITSNSEGITTRAGTSVYYGVEASGFPYGQTTQPSHGNPNNTQYKFYVANPPSTLTSVKVVLTTPCDDVYSFNMTMQSNGNYLLQRTLSEQGRYTVKYRLYYNNSTTTYQEQIPTPSYVDNTKVNVSVGSSAANSNVSMYWVFADGSSFGSPYIQKYGATLQWVSGSTGGGYGYGQGTHTGTDQYYSLDYNLKVSSGTYSGPTNITAADEGTPLYSPIDGKVVLANYTSDYGHRVRIQQTIGNATIDVYLGHLQYSSPTSVGATVYAGQTIVGYLGQTGASSPHLHMNARIVQSNSSLLSVPHSLNAN